MRPTASWRGPSGAASASAGCLRSRSAWRLQDRLQRRGAALVRGSALMPVSAPPAGHYAVVQVATGYCLVPELPLRALSARAGGAEGGQGGADHDGGGGLALEKDRASPNSGAGAGSDK